MSHTEDTLSGTLLESSANSCTTPANCGHFGYSWHGYYTTLRVTHKKNNASSTCQSRFDFGECI